MPLPARLLSGAGGVKKPAWKSPRKAPTKSGKYPRKTPIKPGKSPRKTPTNALPCPAPTQSPAKTTLIIKHNPETNGYIVYSPRPSRAVEESQQDYPDAPMFTDRQDSAQPQTRFTNRPAYSITDASSSEGESDISESANDASKFNAHNKMIGRKHQTGTSSRPRTFTLANRHLVVVRKVSRGVINEFFIRYLTEDLRVARYKFFDDGPAPERYRRGEPTMRIELWFDSKTTAQEAVEKLNAFGKRTPAELVEK